MKAKRQKLKQFTKYAILFTAAVALGMFLEHYSSNKIQVETIALDDTDNDALYVEQSQSDQVINDKININTASVELLDTLEGIGKSTANKIIEYREKNGPFKTIENIMDVSGIGQKTFEVFKDKICAE